MTDDEREILKAILQKLTEKKIPIEVDGTVP